MESSHHFGYLRSPFDIIFKFIFFDSHAFGPMLKCSAQDDFFWQKYRYGLSFEANAPFFRIVSIGSVSSDTP